MDFSPSGRYQVSVQFITPIRARTATPESGQANIPPPRLHPPYHARVFRTYHVGEHGAHGIFIQRAVLEQEDSCEVGVVRQSRQYARIIRLSFWSAGMDWEVKSGNVFGQQARARSRSASKISCLDVTWW